MPLFGHRGAPVDWLIVGLGNPGAQYDGTPHNIGFEVAERLRTRWDLGKPKSKYRGLLSDGRTGPGGPRVAILMPQTYMNEAGKSVGPARGELRVEPDHVIVVRSDSFGMTPMNNPVGAFVYNAHPGLVETILVDGVVVKRAGVLVGVDHSRVRRLAIEARDSIIDRAGGQAGARLGGDWIPDAYVAAGVKA